MKACSCIYSSKMLRIKVKGNKVILCETTFKPFDSLLSKSLLNGGWAGDFALEFYPLPILSFYPQSSYTRISRASQAFHLST